MKKFKTKIANLSMALLFGAAGGVTQAAPVALELLLLVDVSGSVDSTEYNLQKQGYIDAFQNSSIQTLISSAPGGIAVAYAEWSSSNQQSLEVGWTHLTDASSANAFAAAIGASSRDFNGNTAPGSAITWGASLFNNNFEGERTVIDVSGDGAQNNGANTALARDAALADNVDAINGLAILTDEPSLDIWYANNIQGGSGSFTVAASDFADFGAAVITKLNREIVDPVPEPASLALIVAGLLGFRFIKRKKD